MRGPSNASSRENSALAMELRWRDTKAERRQKPRPLTPCVRPSADWSVDRRSVAGPPAQEHGRGLPGVLPGSAQKRSDSEHRDADKRAMGADKTGNHAITPTQPGTGQGAPRTARPAA
jgi:hypothetical protein